MLEADREDKRLVEFDADFLDVSDEFMRRVRLCWRTCRGRMS